MNQLRFDVLVLKLSDKSFQVINVLNIPSVSVYDRGDSDITVEFGLKIVVR